MHICVYAAQRAIIYTLRASASGATKVAAVKFRGDALEGTQRECAYGLGSFALCDGLARVGYIL